MAVKTVTVPGIGAVHLHKRRGARNMRLSITHDGQVRVSLPYWLPYGSAVRFIEGKRDWIQEQQVIPKLLEHGARIGKAHTLSFVPEDKRSACTTRITKDNEIRVRHPAKLSHQDPMVQQAATRASIRALKRQAEKLLPARLETLAAQGSFSYRSVTIKQMKGRWGSCSNQGDIVLNCFLMQLPWRLIDYVLLHELMHTQIMAHGTPFWQELSEHVADLATIRKEIKEHKPILIAQ